jgi:hypothetical protein
MNPFIVPESRRPGVEPNEPKAMVGMTPSRMAHVEQAVPRRFDPEIPLGLDGEEEVEAPPLTMIRPGMRKKREEVMQVSRPKTVTKGWKFWKRPSKRTQELMELKKTSAEISGVMGAVRDHLETANNDRELLRKTLSPLPLAVDGLRRVGDNQRRTHEILEGLQRCVERTAEKDAVFFQAMDRLNDGMSTMDMVVVGMGRTFSSIERNSKASSATLEKLAARIDASDRFMESAFDRFQATEKQFTSYVDTSARRSALVTVAICALMTLWITMLAYTLSRPPGGVPVVPIEERQGVPVEGGGVAEGS